MSFGAELPLLLALGFVVFDPKRVQTMLGDAARAKAELHEASRGIKSQLSGEIKGALQDDRNDDETSSRARHREDDLRRSEVRSRQQCGFDLWQMAKHSTQLAPALA